MLSWQMIWTPCVVLAFILGLPNGAVGVAAAYAIANWVGIIPNYLYCFSGTPIGLRDVTSTLLRPLACTVSSLVIALVVTASLVAGGLLADNWARIFLQVGVAMATYAVATSLFIPFVHAKVVGSLRRTRQAGSI